uniref:Uncharacterized protein n=1 Tax=Panagrolaimus davidi TaxID=227884 RepID=A0A914PGE4_9BILA
MFLKVVEISVFEKKFWCTKLIIFTDSLSTWRFFESVTEQSALRVIEEEAVLDESLFSKLVLELADKFSGRKEWSESVPDLQQPLGETLSTNELEELVDSFQAVTSPSPLLRHHTSLTIEERNRRRSLRDSF